MNRRFELSERDIARLKSKIRETDGCWPWLGNIAETGYGKIPMKTVEGVWRQAYAHRISYLAFVGPLIDGMELDHLCRNPSCVRPDHLEQVPPRINNLRSTSPAALQAQQTECIHGHPFTPENTYMKPGTNKRECRQCMRERDARRAPLRKGYVPPSRPYGWRKARADAQRAAGLPVTWQ